MRQGPTAAVAVLYGVTASSWFCVTGDDTARWRAMRKIPHRYGAAVAVLYQMQAVALQRYVIQALRRKGSHRRAAIVPVVLANSRVAVVIVPTVVLYRRWCCCAVCCTGTIAPCRA